MSEHRFELTFGNAKSILQIGNTLLVRVEALPFDRQPLHLRPHGLNQLCAVLLDSRGLPRELIAPCGGGVELVLHMFGELFGLPQHLLGTPDLPVSVLELSDLGFHCPHHLVQPAGFGGGVVDGDALRFERFRLDADVLGERVQRLEPLLGRRRKRVERTEGRNLRFDLIDHPADDGGVFEGLRRCLANGHLVVHQRRRLVVQLIELVPDSGRLIGGTAKIRVRPLELDLRFGDALPFDSKRLDRGPRLTIFGCELVHCFPVLL